MSDGGIDEKVCPFVKLKMSYASHGVVGLKGTQSEMSAAISASAECSLRTPLSVQGRHHERRRDRRDGLPLREAEDVLCISMGGRTQGYSLE